MALIKSHTLKNGMTAPQAYHIVYKVDTHKRPVDDIDPYGARPDNTPNYLWKAGLYGSIGIAIYADKNARNAGKSPIAVASIYPTERPNNTFSGEQLLWSEGKLKFTVDLQSDKDLIEQAYDHLMSLEEYTGAVRD
jgi:hypothetical protein